MTRQQSEIREMGEPRVEPTDAQGVEIQALAVAAQILDFLASRPGRQSAAEIARALEMTPPRVWRHLNSLEALGFVEGRGDQRGFTLGGRLARLGQLALDRTDVIEIARPHLTELRDVLTESVYLAIPKGDEAVIVTSLDSGGPISLHLALGTTFPAHASAIGRLLMAFAPETRRARFLDAESMPATGHNPIMDPELLQARFETIRARYFDTAQTEQAPRTTGAVFVNAIAAPVFDHTDTIAGGVGVLTGISGEEAISAAKIKDPLFACARRISEGLGSTKWQQFCADAEQ